LRHDGCDGAIGVAAAAFSAMAASVSSSAALAAGVGRCAPAARALPAHRRRQRWPRLDGRRRGSWSSAYALNTLAQRRSAPARWLLQGLVGDAERRVAFGAAREQHGGRLLVTRRF